jgi:hypothetical protein
VKSSFKFRVSSFEFCLAVLILFLLSPWSLRALDRNAFSITQYNLKIQLDPATHGFAADGTVVLRNDSDQPLHNAVLQISSSLDWKSVQMNGKPLLRVTHPFTSDIEHTGELSEAVLTFPEDVAPKGTVELAISYAGVIPKSSARLEQADASKEVAAASDWDEIAENFTALRGIGFVAWYPIATDAVSISDGSSYSLVLQKWKSRESGAQFKLEACTTGVNAKNQLFVFGSSVQAPARQAASAQNAGKQNAAALSCAAFPRVTLALSTPTLVLGALARRDMATEGVDATIVYPADQAQVAGAYAALMKPAEALVNQWFGKAKRSLLIIGLPDAHDVPWESGDALFTPLKREAKLAQLSLVHQFTHAAFPSPRPWIYEGLAHFAQALQSEGAESRAAALEYMAQQLPALLDDEKENVEIAEHAHPRPISIVFTSLVAGNDEVLYRSKAMYVWWMLRDMLGDTVLERALAKYQAEEDTNPAYVQHLLETEAKAAGVTADLETFFNDWVYRDRGLPDFRVASTFARPLLNSPAGNGFLVTITIENLGDAGAEVPVTLSAANKESVTKRLLVPAGGKGSVRITTQNQPQTVTVNDGSVPESDSTNNSATVQVESTSH